MEAPTAEVVVEWWQPAFVCAVFTILIFAIDQGCRLILDRCLRNAIEINQYCNELFSTFTMCSLVFQEAVIFDCYGWFAMFIVIAVHMYLFQAFNRGTGGSILLLFEEALNNKLNWPSYAVLTTIRGFAAVYAMSYFLTLWKIICYFTGMQIEPRLCLYDYKMHDTAICIVEFFGAALLRACLSKLSTPSGGKFVPLLYATLFTAGQVFIGTPGLDPVRNAARLTGCLWDRPEESIMRFVFYYLVCNFGGWMTAARIEPDCPLRSLWRDVADGTKPTVVKKKVKKSRRSSA